MSSKSSSCHLLFVLYFIGIAYGSLETVNSSEFSTESPIANLPPIVGGFKADLMEFPHMAVLGFDINNDTISWDCGGAIISNKWILTVAHCTWKPDAGNVSKVRLGEIYFDDILFEWTIYQVDRIVLHPDYEWTKVYNDIALLELKNKILFSQSKFPACLHTNTPPVNYNKVIAIGFGLTEAGNINSKSKILMKVELELFTPEECSTFFRNSKKIPDGLKNATQICFGSRNESKDTCQGDSGSPLEVKTSDEGDCPYARTIVALTSFGTSCGLIGQPAVYTRISAFVPWIRSIDPNARI